MLYQTRQFRFVRQQIKYFPFKIKQFTRSQIKHFQILFFSLKSSGWNSTDRNNCFTFNPHDPRVNSKRIKTKVSTIFSVTFEEKVKPLKNFFFISFHRVSIFILFLTNQARRHVERDLNRPLEFCFLIKIKICFPFFRFVWFVISKFSKFYLKRLRPKNELILHKQK